MFRATNSLILRSTFGLYIQLLVQCSTDTAADRCTVETEIRSISTVAAVEPLRSFDPHNFSCTIVDIICPEALDTFCCKLFDI